LEEQALAYYSEDSDRTMALKGEQSILFVCVENAGRSQMAEAFAKKRGLRASSAGTMPPASVNPVVVEVMKERGVDISSNKPKMLTVEMINEASLVVTMGCSVEEVCPRPMLARMQKKLVDWNLDDPKGKPIQDVRRIRDEIEARVASLSS
jgi:protein-tyrosine-phosphatase